MAKKILIADDDMQLVMLIAARLRANKYEVIVANDAVQAIAKALKEKPDLILLDNRMPAGSGMNVIEVLRRSANTVVTPIIFITAFPSDRIKQEALEKGAGDFIAKPFDAKELLRKVRKALGDVSPLAM